MTTNFRRAITLTIKDTSTDVKTKPDIEKLRLLGELLSGITHEINTPMHYLDTNLTFLQKAFADLQKLIAHYRKILEEAREKGLLQHSDQELLEKIENEIEPEYLRQEIAAALAQSEEGVTLVSRLVLAMKDFSHPSQHRFSLVDVNKCIETARTITRHEWKLHADFNLNLGRDLPLLFASRDELHQMLINLIVNAAHAVAEKIADGSYNRGQIKVSSQSHNDAILIEVCNDGAEIAAENLGKIFQPYFTTKEPGKGTGVGLGLVRQIVEKEHGGNIRVSSSAQSTCFSILLPHRQNSADL
jgi:signal transduction histidine kinase